MHLRWTPAAFSDLKAISQRIELARNLATANRACRRIYDVIQLLRRNPNSGKPGTDDGTRELVIHGTPYIVVYRVVGSEAVQILRIWHGAQKR
jgi:toxin ParE1/3/4